jgi:hypothetical protein
MLIILEINTHRRALLCAPRYQETVAARYSPCRGAKASGSHRPHVTRFGISAIVISTNSSVLSSCALIQIFVFEYLSYQESTNHDTQVLSCT